MTSQHKTNTHPFYIGMYIHIYTHIYVHKYTSQKECLHIFRETSVPAVPEQLLLLSFPSNAAPCCTDMRNVSDVQSSSRTALAVSVVHLLTETMSWPRQSLTLHTCEYCTRRPSGPIYVPSMFLHLVFQVIPCIELL